MQEKIKLKEIKQTIYEEKPILLSDINNHQIYWVGINDNTAFRCNVYLIVDGNEYIIVDPGSRKFHQQVKNRISKIIEPTKITALILCHQDPDVSASMVDWLEINRDIIIITSARTNVLLPHYGESDYNFFDISISLEWVFESGNKLEFIEAPFMHFAGAFTTLDLTSSYLFSGDIWGALDVEWSLIVEDFKLHIVSMDLFHIDYMASNRATKGFAYKLDNKVIKAILPQHGSIIDSDNVSNAIDYLIDLQCGLDLIYPIY
jgi:flavorubredoxin